MMTHTHSPVPRARVLTPPLCTNMKRTLTKISTLLLLIACASSASAQSSKLPSPDRLVGDYLKAVGGKKRVACVRDATYEWSVLRAGAEAGTARTQLKASGALRNDLLLSD